MKKYPMDSNIDRKLHLKKRLELMDKEIINIVKKLTRRDINILLGVMMYPDCITLIQMDYDLLGDDDDHINYFPEDKQYRRNHNEIEKELKQANINEEDLKDLLKEKIKYFRSLLLKKLNESKNK